MGSVSISILEKKKADYQSKLNAARRNLQTNEEEYDSLVEFKGKILKSQESFYTVSIRKVHLLAGIRPYSDSNMCAHNFIRTIENFTEEAADKGILHAYSSLLGMISRQVTSTYKKIEDLSSDIMRYREKISDLEAEIAYQKSLEV